MKNTLVRSLFTTAILTLTVFVPSHVFAQHGGGAPEPKPLPVAEKAAAVSFAEGVKEDAALASFFREFAEALRTHDAKPFVPRLADNFTIPGYESNDMKAAFVKALTMINGPEEIIITAIEPQTDGTKLIKTGFKFPKRTAKREFTLNADHKLISTTLVSMQRPAGEPARGH